MATDNPSDARYTRTPPKTENPVHSRNLSTTSNVTFFATTSLHSHPTEPLLHATTSQTANYDDHISTNRNETIGRPPYEAPLMNHDNAMNEAKKQGYLARNCQRPLNRWKWLKLGLQAILCEFSSKFSKHLALSILFDRNVWLRSFAHLLTYSCLGHLQHDSIFYCIFAFRQLYEPDFLSSAWNQYRRFLFILFILLHPCHPW